jgi:pimeloyl-[acyl-carrier protein] synthase
LLGLPTEDHRKLRDWSHALTGALDIAFQREAIDSADAAISEMEMYLAPFVEARRKASTDDLLSALVQAEVEGDRLSEKELYAFCIFLLAAGNETTTNLIGNGLLSLLQNLHEWNRLTVEPALVGQAIEELLRFNGPVVITSRVARKTFELRGKRIRDGDFLLLSLAGANRDPRRFPNADTLDISRTDNRHVAFGLGPHFCIGAPLSRMEGEVVFSYLAREFPHMRLDPAKQVDYRDTLAVRGLRELHIILQ